MKTYSLKRTSVPKAAVLVTGLTAAIVAATIGTLPAQAFPRAASCAGCHGAATAGTVTAKPSIATPAPGAAYTVAIALTANANGGDTGYGIVPVTAGTGSAFGGGTGAGALSYTAAMTAPAAAGTYSYTVWSNQGPTDGTARVGSVVYSITVAPPVTTPPTTIPPTTPPTTIPPTTPPTTIAPTTPPTTIAPTTPPTTIAPTTPPTKAPRIPHVRKTHTPRI